ncbi:Uncharacterised protein [Mycobacteroides abscessus subsp. massiliense]|nr:Uncharacterised protein [Mycobacteroides abscessus subsp. massiliense]
MIVSAVNAAGTHIQNDIAVLQNIQQHLRQVGNVFAVNRLKFAQYADGARQGAGIGCGNRLFACGINFGQHQRINGIEDFGKVFKQIACAGIAVWLEGKH